MCLRITVVGRDTVRSTDFPGIGSKDKHQSTSSQRKVASLIIDTKIKFLFPTADNKAWVAIFP